MPSAGLDFSKLTPKNGAVQQLKELIFLALMSVNEIGGLVNFLPRQEHGKKVGFVGEFDDLGQPSTGCDPDYGNDIINMSEKTWDIREWEIAEAICYKDLLNTLAKSALRTKTSIADLTGTEYMDDFLMPRLERAVKKLILRVAFFGDTDATVYNSSSNSSGTLKAGSVAKRYTIADGLWKHIFQGVASGTIKRVEIDANTKTTYKAQLDAMKQKGVASGIVTDLIMNAPPVLREYAGSLRLYCTQIFADCLALDVRAFGSGDLQWKEQFLGIKTAQYAGVEIVALPFWDEIIAKSLQNTTNANAMMLPFRAFLTIKDNLLVGTESENEVADIQVHFDKKDRKNYIYVSDTIGTLIAQDDLIEAAY